VKVLAIIPARSKSVSIKDKNLQEIGKKPLLVWAIEACEDAALVDDFIVSTDSKKYGKVAQAYSINKNVFPFTRPSPLAEDVPSEDVAIHAIHTYEKICGKEFDVILTIQCTTPFIKSSDIDKCIIALKDEWYDSSMTVCEMNEKPSWAFEIIKDGEHENLSNINNNQTYGDWGVRQKWPTLYKPNGMCYASRRELILERKQIIGPNCCPIVVDKVRSIDIDDQVDLDIARAVYEAGLIG